MSAKEKKKRRFCMDNILPVDLAAEEWNDMGYLLPRGRLW
jgi:hypothetical protein